jgi:hypothetical protein
LDFDEASPVFNPQASNPMTQSLRTTRKPSIAVPSRPPAPQQLSMSFESRRAAGTEIDRANQRGRTLALLLLQAAGLDAGGDDGEL